LPEARGALDRLTREFVCNHDVLVAHGAGELVFGGLHGSFIRITRATPMRWLDIFDRIGKPAGNSGVFARIARVKQRASCAVAAIHAACAREF
jgi:hypothetical protein